MTGRPKRRSTRPQSAPRRTAERIAREIKGWLDEQAHAPPAARRSPPTTSSSSVQVRSVLFHEIIRALIREGIPTPGADRLAVTTHIATLDMMALGDVLSNSRRRSAACRAAALAAVRHQRKTTSAPWRSRAATMLALAGDARSHDPVGQGRLRAAARLAQPARFRAALQLLFDSALRRGRPAASSAPAWARRSTM